MSYCQNTELTKSCDATLGGNEARTYRAGSLHRLAKINEPAKVIRVIQFPYGRQRFDFYVSTAV